MDSWKGCVAVTPLARARARVRRGASVGAGLALNKNGASGSACGDTKMHCQNPVELDSVSSCMAN